MWSIVLKVKSGEFFITRKTKIYELKMKINLTLFVVFLLFMVSCGNNKSSNTASAESDIEQPDTQTTVGKSAVHPGKKVYDSVCLACHMANGSGVPGMFPPLIESDFVNGEALVVDGGWIVK